MTDKYEIVKNGRYFSIQQMLSIVSFTIKKIAIRGTSEAEKKRIFQEWDENYNK